MTLLCVYSNLSCQCFLDHFFSYKSERYVKKVKLSRFGMMFDSLKGSGVKGQYSWRVDTASAITIVHLRSNHNRRCAVQKTIKIIARAIADKLDVVSITEVGGGHGSIPALKVAKTDMGKATAKQHRRRTAGDTKRCFGGAKKACSARNRRII